MILTIFGAVLTVTGIAWWSLPLVPQVRRRLNVKRSARRLAFARHSQDWESRTRERYITEHDSDCRYNARGHYHKTVELSLYCRCPKYGYKTIAVAYHDAINMKLTELTSAYTPRMMKRFKAEYEKHLQNLIARDRFLDSMETSTQDLLEAEKKYQEVLEEVRNDNQK